MQKIQNKIISHIIQRQLKNRMKQSILVDKAAIAKDVITFWQDENGKKVEYELTENGGVSFYLLFEEKFLPPFQQTFLALSYSFCRADPKSRRKFYARIKKHLALYKTHKKIRQAVFFIEDDDQLSHSYISKIGKLSYIEFLGKTKTAIHTLKNDPCHLLDLKVRQLKKNEVKQAAAMEIRSHLDDETSRMHELMKKKSFKKNAHKFYEFLVKKNNCISIWNEEELVGTIGYFIRKDKKAGVIATVAVDPDYAGQGIGKLLYYKMCEKMNAMGCLYYTGHSSTKKVLKLAHKLKRKEVSRGYIVDL